MAYNTDLLPRLFGKSSLADVGDDYLSGIAGQYPYFAHAHWLLAIKKWNLNQDDSGLLLAGAYTFHPLRLQQYLTGKDTDHPAVPVTSFIQPLFTEDYFAYTGAKLPQHVENDKRPTMEQLHSFTDWLRTMKRSRGVTDPDLQQDEASLAAHYESEDISIRQNAEASVRADEDIYTEAMAEVRVSAGQIDKAIAIYEKLSLSNPEKSGYFAQKIKALKNN